MRRLVPLAFACLLALASLPACSSHPRRAPDGGDEDASGQGTDGARVETDSAAVGETRLAGGVTLESVALFQGTRVALFDHGDPVLTHPPIVLGRAAVVRAYVDPGARAGETLHGELEVREGDRVAGIVTAAQAIGAPSDDAVPSSVLAFEVGAELVTTTARFAVRLVDPAGEAAASGAPHVARLPRDGSLQPLGARSDGDGMHLVLVPIQWERDGSGRLPDTSNPQLASIRELLLAVYPLAHLTVQVHAPVPWSDALTITGNVDFGSINGMLMSLRDSDGAPPGAYYYALVNAADTYDAYCGGSCVTGQSYVTDAPQDADFRVGSGVGFSGEDSVWTLVHEVGHEAGRSHAPCDTGGADPDFPYDGGSIGVWGYDPRTRAFQDPATVTDFMGYCWPTWTSDYTWSAIFERTVAVSALASAPRRASLLVRLGGQAGTRVMGEARVHPPHGSERVLARWQDALGRDLGLALAPTLATSHGDERVAVFPAPPTGAASIVIDGRSFPLDP